MENIILVSLLILSYRKLSIWIFFKSEEYLKNHFQFFLIKLSIGFLCISITCLIYPPMKLGIILSGMSTLLLFHFWEAVHSNKILKEKNHVS